MLQPALENTGVSTLILGLWRFKEKPAWRLWAFLFSLSLGSHTHQPTSLCFPSGNVQVVVGLLPRHLEGSHQGWCQRVWEGILSRDVPEVRARNSGPQLMLGQKKTPLPGGPYVNPGGPCWAEGIRTGTPSSLCFHFPRTTEVVDVVLCRPGHLSSSAGPTKGIPLGLHLPRLVDTQTP